MSIVRHIVPVKRPRARNMVTRGDLISGLTAGKRSMRRTKPLESVFQKF